MTTADSTSNHAPPEPTISRVARWWLRCEELLLRASEWFNPILVKEARQALKSRQFLITFSLLLICGWGWSLVGIASMSNNYYYMSAGAQMLIGYYWILAFPMFVIVPFSAFRSLAAEREDGTYELLSITSLRPRQIISGKLGSAVLQMMVYYSGLSPCIVFTYLLRGVDIVTIVLILFYTFFSSVILSIVALFLATITRARHWQVALSVGAIVGLVWLFWGAGILVQDLLEHSGGVPLDDQDFWIAQVLIVASFGSYACLAFLAASAAISFATDNRSTKLRIAMAGQQIMLVGLVVFCSARFGGDEEGLFVSYVIAGIHWAITGAMMTGESTILSQRVSRGLPQSVLGQLYFSLFTPGPGTGYLFVLANMLSLIVVFTFVSFFASTFGWFEVGHSWLTFSIGYVTLCYLAIYLGMGKLIVDLIRPYANTGPAMALLINVILALGIPFSAMMIQLNLYQFPTSNDYTLLQIVNPFWTIIEILESQWRGGGFANSAPVMLLLTTSAVVAFVANVLSSAGQMRRERQATPARVAQDEAELHPVKEPARKPTSPWDEDDANGK